MKYNLPILTLIMQRMNNPNYINQPRNKRMGTFSISSTGSKTHTFRKMKIKWENGKDGKGKEGNAREGERRMGEGENFKMAVTH